MSDRNYFETRIKELNSLFDNSNSQTSKQLISEVKNLSHTAFSEYKRVFSAANKKIIDLDGKKAHFDAVLVTMKNEMKKMDQFASNEFFSENTRMKVNEAAQAMSEDVQYQYDIRIQANRLLREAISFCSEELKKTLLELIFKPNSSSFISDSVDEVFKTLAQKMVPFSDDLETILSLKVSARKKDYLSQGDKILSYLENYKTVLELWMTFNEKFDKEVLSD